MSSCDKMPEVIGGTGVVGVGGQTVRPEMFLDLRSPLKETGVVVRR